MSKKERVVVICPGRGSYTEETLGYLNPYRKLVADFITDIDQRRIDHGDPSISELDQAQTFNPDLHEKGEHASTLIYSCSYADFQSIDRERFDIVAITGNSMGWYLALAFSEALNRKAAFDVIQTMGEQMREEIIGGQILYPIIDSNWKVDPRMVAQVENLVEDINGREGMEAYSSIYLGGYRVIGGNELGVQTLLKELPTLGRFPIRLDNHAAFHTPMLQGVSDKVLNQLPTSLFDKPKIPVVDGRGKIWRPETTDTQELHQYTLGHQVVKPYNFTKAVTTALEEFSPDKLILLGPSGKIGGAIGQILIMNEWKGITCRRDFTQLQKKDPHLLSMGLIGQRALAGINL